eukprot:TRINITY_DN8185_c0_g1_i1.p1 TRINITY_DN8185_c0_g1~~TRINITY_DN8185_c0_g1_i1.p1  ORF type:complete len:404 (+),score=43.87 TRINITY_DN8185_c0_g1_i1:152-1363(+)
MKKIVFEETCGTIKKCYVTDQKEITLEKKSTSKGSFKQFFYEAFLPEGYPHSVSKDYLSYQIWDSIQALCSSLTGTLATRAILVGAGVGEAEADPTAAAVQYILKDGASKLGSIMFTWTQGSNLDCNAKTWRLMADLINDSAFFFEILIGIFPKYFLLLASIAGIMKAVVGVAGGATRAALTQHQARRNNMADVAAKDGSQETANSLLGLVLATVLIPIITRSNTMIWAAYVFLTIMHLLANYKAVSGVILEKLNRQRADLVLDQFLKDGTTPDPAEISKRERILHFDSKKTVLGCSISNLVHNNYDELVDLINNSNGENFLLKQTKKNIIFAIHKEATQKDIMKAYFTAELMHRKQYKSATETSKLFESFLKKLDAAGWNTDHYLLGVTEWRCSWDSSLKNK